MTSDLRSLIYSDSLSIVHFVGTDHTSTKTYAYSWPAPAPVLPLYKPKLSINTSEDGLRVN